MNINREQIRKLKQLDRIEFMQRYEGICKAWDYNISLNLYFITLIFVFIMDIWGRLRIGEWLINVRTFMILSELIILCIFLELVISLGYLVIRTKKLKELKKEYFKIEVKK